MSRDQLADKLRALLEEQDELRAGQGENERLVHELHVHQVELEMQNRQVRCDRDRMFQVLSNLVGNAEKFSQTGQTIRVDARQQRGETVVSVADEGPGIAPDKQPHVFERYFKTNHGEGGAGLGLYIAQGIVAAHGGRVWVESTEGHGSTFYFTIPNASVAEQSRPL